MSEQQQKIDAQEKEKTKNTDAVTELQTRITSLLDEKRIFTEKLQECETLTEEAVARKEAELLRKISNLEQQLSMENKTVEDVTFFKGELERALEQCKQQQEIISDNTTEINTLKAQLEDQKNSDQLKEVSLIS